MKLWLVRRADAAHDVFVATAILDLDDELEGWEMLDGTVRTPYEDDSVFQVPEAADSMVWIDITEIVPEELV